MNKPTKLFFAKNVCSLAPHIVLHELGLAIPAERVDLRTHQLASGGDFFALSPRGYVPALELDDGSILSETAVILRYLADLAPERALAPAAGTMARVRFDEALHFIATELHKAFAPFTIMDAPSAESRAWAARRLEKRVALIATAIGDRPFYAGESFTVLDAYAFWALGTYAALTKTPLPENLRAYRDALAARPSVRAALAAESMSDAERHES